MAFKDTYTKDSEGNMILVSSVEVPDEILPPNWVQLKSDLLTSPVLAPLISITNPQGFTVFTTYLTSGEFGNSNPDNFPTYFAYMGLTLTIDQKSAINTILTNNNFTIQLT